MQRREKYLLIGLLAAVVLWWGLPVLQSVFLGPIEERRSQLQTLELTLKKKKEQEADIMVATRRLGDAKDRSLPPDALDAQRLYQEWLTDLAQMAGFTQLKITPDRRVAKGKTYVAVLVSLDGEATFEQLSRFLFYFHRTNLLHRITRLTIRSPASEGNPGLTVSLTAEGLSLQDAPSRDRLFVESSLARPLLPSDTTLTLKNTAAFPKTPGFRVRIGSEYLTVVTVANESWTVARGSDGTRAVEHAAGETVELAPVAAAYANRRLEEYRTLVANSPFVKPQKYQPRLDPLENQVVTRGTPWSLSIKAGGFDPSLGPLLYSLAGELPTGVTIDPQSGKLSWTPSADVATGDYRGIVSVRPANGTSPTLTQPLRLTLREPNSPPVVEAIDRQEAFLGATLSFSVVARDPDEPANRLTYALEAAPQGAAIDAATGRVHWTPPLTLEPGDYELIVVVSDDGTPPQRATQKVAVRLADDAAQFTYLVASIDTDDERQAWLYDRSSNRKMVVREGTTFQVADIEARVTSIGRDFVLLDHNQSLWRIELGQTLRTMQQLNKTSAATPPPATAETTSGE